MSEHYIAFWNLENLFAPEDYADRIDWVRAQTASDLAGWSQALYDRKRAQLAKVIAAMNVGAGPAILGVCEVEDEKVLNDLIATIAPLLPARDYKAVFATADLSFRGIDTAFIFDANAFTVDSALVFNHFVMRRTGTRDILQATFISKTSNAPLVVMANHWPSRSGGGAAASAGFRATAGETLSYWHKRAREEAQTLDRTPILAMGDFNDDPWDASLTFNAIATRERGDVERGKSEKFYNFAWEFLQNEVEDHRGNMRTLDGTLYYKNNGNLFDQVLANRPLLDADPSGFKVVDGSAGVFTLPEMVSHKVGNGPIRFGTPKGNVADNIDENGFSDHFPVKIVVRET